jgi:predicted enzyme related to lactoylglutathione lyase
MTVTETFFSIDVDDMARAAAFYVGAFGATVAKATPMWSSLAVAGVRLGLFRNPAHVATRIGLHFAVSDLAAARADVVRAGGSIVTASLEPAPGVVIAIVTDTERNTFTLVQE